MRPGQVNDALSDGIGPTLNQLGAEHGCAPLHWRMRGSESGRPGTLSGMAACSAFTDEVQAAAALTCWAELLGLQLDADKYVALRYSGEVDGHPVEIWHLPRLAGRSAAQL